MTSVLMNLIIYIENIWELIKIDSMKMEILKK